MGGWADDDGSTSARTSGQTKIEIANSLRLTDEVHRLARGAIETRSFRMTPALLCDLHRIAMDAVIEGAGEYRKVDEPCPIRGSRHQPPTWQEVPAYVESMCSFINALPPLFLPDLEHPDFDDALAVGVNTAAYALWRVNWIHPFEDGNGRTSRALCYLIFTVHGGMLMPGVRALPERISSESQKFYRCLEASDIAHKKKRAIRLQQSVNFIRKHILAQLAELAEVQRISRPPGE